ncbi:MAG: hypothetical protein C0424_10970, partial [Sphingobacteriaceae bacterium]|nr:hypothetical protein [Sphingobacteriaceae bacterium]
MLEILVKGNRFSIVYLICALVLLFLLQQPVELFGQSGVRTVYDVTNRSLIFQNKTNISGNGTGVSNIVRFNNVVSVDGDNIDAVVTTTNLSNATFDSYDSDVNPSTVTSFFQPNINGTSSPSLVGFNIEFYKAGTFTGVGTGTRVTLQNLVINSYDIDGNGSHNQYQEFRGFTSFETVSNANISSAVQADGSVRFTSTVTTNSTSIYADRHRVRVTYASASSILVKMGAINGIGSAWFALDLSLGPAWTNPPVVNPSPAPLLTFSTVTFNESSANNGSIGNTATLTLSNNKTFAGTNGAALTGVTFTNVPAGLTASLVRTGTTTATLSFTGAATLNNNADDVNNVGVSLGDAAFTGGNAAGVTGSSRQDLILNFNNNPTKLAINTQPSSTVQSGAVFAQQPRIQLQDASNANIPQSGVVVTVAIASGGGTLSGTTTATTDANGLATFSGLIITGSGGNRTLSFTASGLTAVTSNTINVQGPAARLQITTEPSASAANNVVFVTQPAVQLRDAAGNNVSQSGVVITASILTGGGTLGGTLTATTNSNGLATFSGLRITGTTGIRTLLFSSGSLTPDTSANVNITVGAAARILITTEPSATVANGVVLPQQPVVRLVDAGGNFVNQNGTVITAAILTGGGTLGGPLTATTNGSGVATFANLQLTGLVGNRTLRFTGSSLTSDTSTNINLTVGSANKIAIITQPSSTAGSGTPLATQPVVEIQDIGNNPILVAGTNIAVSILTGGGTLGGTATLATNAQGRVSYTGLSITGSAGNRTLSFASSGVTSATSNDISITTATVLKITTEPSANAQNGINFPQQPVVQLRDANGLDISQSGVVVNAAILTGGGALGGTVTATTDSQGRATFINLRITGTIGNRTLVFTATGLTPDTSATVVLAAGNANRLAIITQPNSTAENGVAFSQQPVVEVRDVNNNPVLVAGTVINVNLSSGTGVLLGTLSATTASNGRATFSGLNLAGTNGTKRITFTSTSLTSVQSGNISLVNGPASVIVITTEPSSTATNDVPFLVQPQVRLRDVGGNNISISGVVITASVLSGDGVLNGPVTTTTNSSGVAIFSNLRITGVTGIRTLLFSASGYTPDTSTNISVAAGGPSRVVITTEPSATAVSGTVFAQQPVVQLVDSSGNNVLQSGIAVTVSLASGSGILGGTLTGISNNQGIVSFTDLMITGPLGARTLVFQAGEVTPDTSIVVNLVPGSPTRLEIVNEPSSSAQNNVVFAQQPTVRLKDANGNNVLQSGVVITAVLASGSDTLQGSLSATTDANGIATFTNLKINGITGIRTIRFTSGSLTPDTSSNVAIVPGAAAQLLITTEPSATAQNDVNFAQQPRVQLRDASGNNVQLAGVTIMASLASGSATLGGTLSATTDAQGLATFTNLKITGATGVRTIRFTSGSLTPDTSINVTITPGAATQLAIATEPSATAQNDVNFAQQPTVQLKDASGNNVAQSGVTITAVLASGANTLGGTLTATTDAQGLATFTNLKITGPAGVRAIRFTSGSLIPDTSANVTITPGAATTLLITTEPSATAQNDVNFAQQPRVQLRDASGNNVAQAGVTITAVIASGANTLGGTLTATTDANGLATFTNLKITGATGMRTISFTSGSLTPDTSTNVTITPGAATQLAIITQPSTTAQSGIDFTQQPVLELRDISGNPVPTAGTSIIVAIASGGGTLGGTATVTTDANGRASFSGLDISGTVGNRTLSFTSSGLTAATSNNINITAGAATQIAINAGNNQTAVAGAAVATAPSVIV